MAGTTIFLGAEGAQTSRRMHPEGKTVMEKNLVKKVTLGEHMCFPITQAQVCGTKWWIAVRGGQLCGHMHQLWVQMGTLGYLGSPGPKTFP